MELTIKYSEHAAHSLSAAFIRGNNPAVWLQEMNEWQIPLLQLVCYIVSQNNNPVEAAGLFVVFNKEQMPGMVQVKQPYTVLGGKLYIPIDAELSPAISERELQSLLMWHCQVLHPTLGFIGFEKHDRIALPDLLQYTPPKDINWEYAQPGNGPFIPLHQINVQRLTAEEIFESVKETIGNKDLLDIPKSNKKDVPSILNNKIAEGLLKGTYNLLKGIGSILPSSGGGSGKGGSSTGSGTGFMSRFMNWMQEKIEDLEKQRDSELKRLSDMFEKNVDEFLQYAIPLSSPYMNRGTAPQSARLSKQPSQFNLGRLGGGYAVDGWDLDKYHNDLRSKYLKAAQQAIDKKDYKKAAYVYAHLLGDYALAATTLKHGKHYREAAIIYKDHLKNQRLAAECYAEGGLYAEAIELYTEVFEFEKAGDLYRELDQNDRALICYEDSVARAVLNNDYLEQSRIINDKIGDRPRAKEVLLEGWKDVKQPEACLTKYFDLVANDNKEQLHTEIKNFYTQGELKDKKLSFLNVIDDVNKKHKTTELENTCRNIAYEVVSEEVSAGRKASLHHLKDFIANDQLLSPDCYRFIHTNKEAPEQKPASNEIILVNDVAWKKVTVWQNQLLVWGIKPAKLVLARVSSSGQVEYVSWPVNDEFDEYFIPIANPEYTNNIVLYTYELNLADKLLVQNKHFQDQLRIFQPQVIHSRDIGIGMREGDLITLTEEHDKGILNRYSLAGEVITSVQCVFNEKDFSVPVADCREMIWCNGFYYMICLNMIWRISDDGAIDVLFYLQASIMKLVVHKQPNGVISIGFYSGYRAFFMTSADDPHAGPFEVSEEDVLIKDVAILPGNRYVVASTRQVSMYYDVEDNKSPELYWQLDTKYDLAAVFEGTERNQLGIIGINGKITFHVIN